MILSLRKQRKNPANLRIDSFQIVCNDEIDHIWKFHEGNVGDKECDQSGVTDIKPFVLRLKRFQW